MAELICADCGTQGYGATHTKGSFGIELVLWGCGFFGLLLFVIPGLIFLVIALCYSLSRLAGRSRVCPACRGPHLIPTNSPRGVELRTRYVPLQTPVDAAEHSPVVAASAVTALPSKPGSSRNAAIVIVVVLFLYIAGFFANVMWAWYSNG